MPMIEIDDPKVIARARRLIAEQADRLRRHQDTPHFSHSSFMLVTGYLMALLDNDLFIVAAWEQLCAQSNEAGKADAEG